MKIKRMADAEAIASLMVEGNFQKWYCPGYDAEKPFIQLWDTFDENRIMIIIEQSRPDCFLVYLLDTVNDTEVSYWFSISEIEEAIWHHRKFINKSGQLDNL